METEELKNEPLSIYGYGIVAFFKLMESLIKSLLLITICIAIPQIFGNIWLPMSDINPSFQIYDASLANSGYSYVNRILIPSYINSLYVVCDRTII